MLLSYIFCSSPEETAFRRSYWSGLKWTRSNSPWVDLPTQEQARAWRAPRDQSRRVSCPAGAPRPATAHGGWILLRRTKRTATKVDQWSQWRLAPDAPASHINPVPQPPVHRAGAKLLGRCVLLYNGHKMQHSLAFTGLDAINDIY